MYGPGPSPMPMPPSAGGPAGEQSALLQALLGGSGPAPMGDPTMRGMDDPMLQQILMQIMMEQGGPAGAAGGMPAGGGMMPGPAGRGPFPGGGY